MPIIWVQMSPAGWVACLNQYRAVVTKVDGVWIARIEDGAVVYPARITFHALEGAKQWAERKLCELARLLNPN